MEFEGEWRLIREEARSGDVNMALDEIAAETAVEDGLGTVRAFRWEPSTLSMGYGQNEGTVDREFCERNGIDVVRRPTGGGGIYHDAFGDISYSIVVPAQAVPGDLLESYHLLLDPVLDALERMGVDGRIAERERASIHEPACYLRAVNPAHDLVVDGRKISGNAQHRTRNAVVQHGSITYARATDRHLGVFADAGISPAEFEERVTSIREQSGIERPDAVDALEIALTEWAGAEAGSWTESELTAARDLASEKFSSDGWIRRR